MKKILFLAVLMGCNTSSAGGNSPNSTTAHKEEGEKHTVMRSQQEPSQTAEQISEPAVETRSHPQSKEDFILKIKAKIDTERSKILELRNELLKKYARIQEQLKNIAILRYQEKERLTEKEAEEIKKLMLMRDETLAQISYVATDIARLSHCSHAINKHNISYDILEYISNVDEKNFREFFAMFGVPMREYKNSILAAYNSATKQNETEQRDFIVAVNEYDNFLLELLNDYLKKEKKFTHSVMYVDNNYQIDWFGDRCLVGQIGHRFPEGFPEGEVFEPPIPLRLLRKEEGIVKGMFITIAKERILGKEEAKKIEEMIRKSFKELKREIITKSFEQSNQAVHTQKELFQVAEQISEPAVEMPYDLETKIKIRVEIIAQAKKMFQLMKESSAKMNESFKKYGEIQEELENIAISISQKEDESSFLIEDPSKEDEHSEDESSFLIEDPSFCFTEEQAENIKKLMLISNEMLDQGSDAKFSMNVYRHCYEKLEELLTNGFYMSEYAFILDQKNIKKFLWSLTSTKPLPVIEKDVTVDGEDKQPRDYIVARTKYDDFLIKLLNKHLKKKANLTHAVMDVVHSHQERFTRRIYSDTIPNDFIRILQKKEKIIQHMLAANDDKRNFSTRAQTITGTETDLLSKEGLEKIKEMEEKKIKEMMEKSFKELEEEIIIKSFKALNKAVNLDEKQESASKIEKKDDEETKILQNSDEKQESASEIEKKDDEETKEIKEFKIKTEKTEL